jgi:hypothetical protein
MTIDRVVDNAFAGMYKTAVSGNGTALEAPVSDSFNPSAATVDAITFAVDWQYDDEEGEKVVGAAAWCGVVRDKAMRTTWLLTRYGDPADDWDSTNIGMNTFEKLRASCLAPYNSGLWPGSSSVLNSRSENDFAFVVREVLAAGSAVFLDERRETLRAAGRWRLAFAAIRAARTAGK